MIVHLSSLLREIPKNDNYIDNFRIDLLVFMNLRKFYQPNDTGHLSNSAGVCHFVAAALLAFSLLEICFLIASLLCREGKQAQISSCESASRAFEGFFLGIAKDLISKLFLKKVDKLILTILIYYTI